MDEVKHLSGQDARIDVYPYYNHGIKRGVVEVSISRNQIATNECWLCGVYRPDGLKRYIPS